MTKAKLEQIKTQHLPTVTQKQKEWREKHNTPFYTLQTRLVLRNCDIIDPISIEEYIATDGYFALEKVLTKMTGQHIIDTVLESGLRGRGGAGFPSGRKWQFVKGAIDERCKSCGKDKTKCGDIPGYIVCNGDEGDPGAFMDRAILENDPYSVIEAMTIAGFATGATAGYIYVRAEYPQAVKNCRVALKRAREMGVLGKNIMGTGFDFDLTLKLGAGAFVCGEETSLLASIEGKRGEPRPRPPFPAVRGLFDKPTLINNVETLSAIPMLILKGPERFNKIGTEKSKGTKVFALAGTVPNAGLVEVEMGTTIHKLVYEIGGCKKEDNIKAVQAGGPSGGCIPASLFHLPLDYDSLQSVGSMLGSGGIVVMNDRSCMIDVSKFFIKFSVDESCGKCVPCRIGNSKLLNILEKISEGKGKESDLDELETLSKVIIETSLCGLGQSSPNPVKSTLTHFRDEYIRHIKSGKCDAGACKSLCNFIINEKCIMCTQCIKVCPVDAITGAMKQPHTLHQDICIKCGKCVPICPVNAIIRV